MTICVYYDQPQVDAADVARARASCGAAAIHIHPADIAWPETCSTIAHTVRPARDAVVRTSLTALLDAIQAQVESPAFRGADLLEIVRMEWLGGLLDDFHRAWVVGEIASRWRPTTIHWVADAPRPFRALQAYCAGFNIRLLPAVSRLHLARRSLGRVVADARCRLWEVRDRRRTAALARRLWADRPQAPRSSRPIVFAEYFPNSAKTALKIAAEVNRRHAGTSLLVAGRPSVLDAFGASGLPCRLIDEFRLSPGAVGRGDRRSLAKVTREFIAAVAQMPDDRFVPRSGSPPARALLQAALIREARREFPRAARWVQSTQGLLETLRPVAVVSTTYSSSFGRALAAVAESADVPSIYVQHGLFPNDAFWARFLNRRILVWGDSNRRAFLNAGVAADRVRVVGAPGHDVVAKLPAAAQCHGRTVRFLYLAPRTGGTVVSRPVAERTVLAIARVVLAALDRELTIKLHPGDHTGLIPRLVAGRERVRIEQRASSLDEIHAADIVIVNSSTTGLEACALDKPMIVFNLTGTSEDVDYQSYGAALCVQREVDLPTAVQRVLDDEPTRTALRAGRRRLVDDMLAGATGRATQAAADAILEAAGLVSEKPTATLA